MSEIQQRAAGSDDMGVKTTGFWAMENLGATFLRHLQPGQTLNDPALPVEIRPIAHCGMGIGAVEVSKFEPGKLAGLLQSLSNPAYDRFGFDNVGAMLGVYEPDIFAMFSRSFTFLGLLPIAPLEWPEPAGFLRAFDQEAGRLIANGYGRMLYFKSNSISRAVRLAARAGSFRFDACVQGIAFAYSMANHNDLQRVWQAGEDMGVAEVGSFFRNGLIYAIEFWEWMSPGTIDALKPRTSYAAALISAARDGVAIGRARGALAPFLVESPAD